jgi:hypothetical protein
MKEETTAKYKQNTKQGSLYNNNNNNSILYYLCAKSTATRQLQIQHSADTNN